MGNKKTTACGKLQKQVGNSVNVHAVETIAKQLKIILCKLQHNF